MTREEAIWHIRDVINIENNSIKPIVIFEQEKEALYMAIKALQNLSKPINGLQGSDLISRAVAIKAITEEYKSFEKEFAVGEDDEEYGHFIGHYSGLCNPCRAYQPSRANNTAKVMMIANERMN